MRSLVFWGCLASVLFAGPTLMAQDTPLEIDDSSDRPLNTITFDPVPLALTGILSLEYERAINTWISVFGGPAVDFGFTSIEVDGVDDSDASHFGIGLQAGVRFFMLGDAPEGLFIGPDFGLAYAAASVDDVDSTGLAWTVGALFGYTFLIADIVDLSIGLGAQYIDAEASAEDITIGFSGWLPSARLAIGAAF